MSIFLFFCLLITGQANAAVIWEDNLESGVSGWDADGFWHLQANPQYQHVRADLYEDNLTLPDMGYLPYANSGQHVWWYGESKTGTYIGWPYPAQTPLSGGSSATENSGELITPQIDLTNIDTSTLSFWTWWEIEAVAPIWYDWMTVSVSTNKIDWNDLDLINPTIDVFGGAPQPYSSGGVGSIGNWIRPKFDLTPYAGQKIYIRFLFESEDSNFNGFRGWLIDDIKVSDKKILPSFKGARAYSLRKCEDGQMVTDPGLFRVTEGQWVDVAYSQKFVIAKHGKYERVCANSKTCYLPAGTYMLWSYNFDKNNDCPNGQPSSATVTFDRAGVWPAARTINDPLAINFFGKNFTSGMEASFENGTSDQFKVVSGNQGQILNPEVAAAAALEVREDSTQKAGEWSQPIHDEIKDNTNRGIATLPVGKYDLIISGTGGTGQKTMKNALTITPNQPPIITDGTPLTVNNDVGATFTFTGENLSDNTKVLIGGMPLEDVNYDPSTQELSGIVKKGLSPGFQTVLVKNPDGLIGTYLNIIEVKPITNDLYDGMNTTNLSRPATVKKINVTHLDGDNIKISWKKKNRANFYRYRIKYEGKVVKRGKIKDPKHSKILDEYFVAEFYGKTVKVEVKAFNKYKGIWSQPKTFLVE